MFIGKNNYVKLISHNKNLTKEVYDLQRQIKYLTKTNDEYYKEAEKWKHNYDKMREMLDDRETESSIVAQRDEEIEALKHMLERLETEQEDYKTVIRALNKDNDKLTIELNVFQQKLNYLRDVFETNLELAELNCDEDRFKMWKAFLMEMY